MKRILVTGAGGNASQNFVKSLRLGGDFFIVGADTNKYQIESSDLEKKYYLRPWNAPNYLDRLNEVIDTENIEFLHAQPDVEVENISANRSRIPTNIFLPSHETIVLCHDKFKTNQRLRGFSVPAPKSFLVERTSDIPEILDELDGEKFWLRAVRGAGSRAALPVKTHRHAEEWIHYWRTTKMLESKDFMISEFLPGKEFAFQSLWYKGELVTSMARERVEYLFGNLLPSGQSSSPSVARTIHRNDVNDVATRAIFAVNDKPHGVFCVDMKENVDGVPSITEINVGRFFTTSDFFSVAGSNMPLYYLKLAFGEPIPELPKYNAVPSDLYWVRGVDREPKLVYEDEWTSVKAMGKVAI